MKDHIYHSACYISKCTEWIYMTFGLGGVTQGVFRWPDVTSTLHTAQIECSMQNSIEHIWNM